jgi:hypothetical protein
LSRSTMTAKSCTAPGHISAALWRPAHPLMPAPDWSPN